MEIIDELAKKYENLPDKPKPVEFIPPIYDDNGKLLGYGRSRDDYKPISNDNNNNINQPRFVAPERRSYYVAGNVANNEVNTTAQKPNEIEYEANTVDNAKEKDKYFALTKLDKDKPSIIKDALKNAISIRYNPLAIGVVAQNKLNEITGKNNIELASEAGRGFLASTVDFGSSLYRFFKENIDIAKTYTTEQLDKIANVGNVLTGGKSLRDEIDKKYTEFYKQINEDNINLKNKTEKFLQYSGIGKTDNDGFIYDLAGGGASLLYALAFYAITKSPVATAEFFGAYQYQSLYEEGIEKGFSQRIA